MARHAGVRLLHYTISPLAFTAGLVAATTKAWAIGPDVRFEQAPAMPKTHFGGKPAVSPEAPVLLEAERVDYQDGGLVLASGNVAVTQGETVLLADTLAYDQEGEIVIAQGHVSILDPSGNVYFADEVELKSDMKRGVVQQFKARFNDNSLLAAVKAKKIDENKTELFKTVYSPCDCVDDDTGKPTRPLWSIKANHALIDQEAQRIAYDDVYFNFYDVPVFYSPYLAHSTPGADNKSGFLMPEYWSSENTGSMVKVPYYYAIAPDRDFTFTPIFTSKESPVLSGEYRQQFDTGWTTVEGSLTNPQRRDASGDTVSGRELRGHIDAKARFELPSEMNWGFELRRATDDTYLRRYNLGYDTLLTSRAYVEQFNPLDLGKRSYASVTALAFQGLTAQDDRRRIPGALPLMTFSHEGEPGWNNSRLTLDGNLLSLYRQIGDKSRRISATAGWNLPYITDDGQVIEFRSQLRGDAYWVDDVVLSDGSQFDGTTGRLIPQASMLWRYPFVTRNDTSSFILEPVVMSVISPGGGNPEKIPNEDSVAPEFTDSNLFDANRFAGYDRVEHGPRVSYGMRGQAQLFEDKYIDWLIGQNYRVYNDRNFPFTNDLVSHFSDYVGKFGLTYNPFAIAYRYRLDKEDWQPKRQEVDGSFGYDPLWLSLSYLTLKNDPVLANKEILSAGGRLKLTKDWSLTMNGSKDLELGQVTSTSTGILFQNECTSFAAVMGREYTRDRDIEPSTVILLKVSFKNLE